MTDVPDRDPRPEKVNFLIEIWQRYRPYLIHLTVDLLVSASVWLVLFLFKLLADWMPISDWAGKFIVNIHAAGGVGAFAVFATLFIIDVVNIRRGTHT